MLMILHIKSYLLFRSIDINTILTYSSAHSRRSGPFGRANVPVTFAASFCMSVLCCSREAAGLATQKASRANRVASVFCKPLAGCRAHHCLGSSVRTARANRTVVQAASMDIGMHSSSSSKEELIQDAIAWCAQHGLVRQCSDDISDVQDAPDHISVYRCMEQEQTAFWCMLLLH